MRELDGWYYLHTSGDLIFKRTKPEIEPGGFVRRVWAVDKSNRACAWIIAIEALAMGARRERIDELAAKWGLTDEDAPEFVARFNAGVGKDLLVLSQAAGEWSVSFTEGQNDGVGRGSTALEALGDLISRVAGNLEGRVCRMFA